MANNKKQQRMRKQKRIWVICRLGVLFFSIVTFTPLVIPSGTYQPELFGLPYTLWVGMLISVSFVVLILLGIKAHRIVVKNIDE